MFRTACIFAAFALCAATAPPRISLELFGSAGDVSALSASLPAHTSTTNNIQNTDLTLSCQADKTTGSAAAAANCKFPVAKAYDHLDGEITSSLVVERKLVDDDHVTTTTGTVLTAAQCTGDCDNLSQMTNPVSNVPAIEKRSTYLFTYDVSDAASNAAEQVVFALIINDVTAPDVAGPTNLDLAIEADTATDLNAGHAESEYTCSDPTKVDADSALVKTSDRTTALTWDGLTDDEICASSHETTITCTDLAGFYGDSDAANFVTMTMKTTISDSVDPTLTIVSDDFECDAAATTVAHTNTAITCEDNTGDVAYDALTTTNLTNADITAVLLGADGNGVTCAGDTYSCTHDFTATCTDNCANTHTVAHTVTVVDTTPPDVDETYSGDNNADTTLAGHSSATVGNAVTHTFNIMPKTGTDWNTECGSDRHNSSFDITSPASTCSRETGSMFHDETGFEYVAYETCSGTGDCKIDVHNIADVANENMKFHAHAKFSDTCCMNQNASHMVATWVGAFDPHVAGTYIRRFSIDDCAGNTASVDVNVVLQDKDAPLIHMEGCDADSSICTNTLEASNTVEYTDNGAQCHDYVDGVLSHAVEVSGQVVNMRVIGTYVINYNCADLSGNDATAETRTVIVQDTGAPVCSFAPGQGVAMNFVEAGFPYIDAGATMSDELDGECTSSGAVNCTGSDDYGSLTATGNTVNTGEAFYNFDSCDSIRINAETKSAPLPANGQYVITPAGGSKRVLVNCYFGTEDSIVSPALSFLVFFGTDFVVGSSDCKTLLGTDAERWVVGSSDADYATAETALMQSVDFVSRTPTVQKKLAEQTLDTQHSMHNGCVIKVVGSAQDADPTPGKAEPGVYRIVFTGQDRAENPCDPITRTVIVRDTLPPVISLIKPETNETLYQHPSDGAVGLRGETNYDDPTGAAHFKFNLMAETSSVNGWFIGAVACAVSGVALLATSMKKAATSVPV
jgi:hypothetical protein